MKFDDVMTKCINLILQYHRFKILEVTKSEYVDLEKTHLNKLFQCFYENCRFTL